MTTAYQKRRKNPWFRRETLIAWLFILPSFVGFVTFYIFPSIRGIAMSFTDWDLLTPPENVGFDNYRRLLTDKLFWNSLKVTAYYVLLNIPFQTVIALTMATLMHRLTASIFVRGALVLPYLISNVVASLLWLWMLDPSLGIVNQGLLALGLERLAFLSSPELAMPSVAWINNWRHTGYVALLFFAGMQTIPISLYEAAAIDGANEVRKFFNITLPLLRPVMAFVLVTSVVGSFQVFDTIAVTTQGGPINATRVVVWYIYEFAFQRFSMGYATTIAVALFLILISITLVQMRLLQANRSDLG